MGKRSWIGMLAYRWREMDALGMDLEIVIRTGWIEWGSEGHRVLSNES